jgi:hypothetical protein
MEPPLTWQKIVTPKALSEIKNQWSELNNGSNQGNLFTSYDWINNWLLTFYQPHWQLHVFIAHHKNNIVAIAPFYTQKGRSWHQPVKLCLLGQGEPEKAEVASEYSDILIASGYQLPVYNYLAVALKKLKYDRVCCRAILADSHLATFFYNVYQYKAMPAGYRYLVERKKWAIAKLSKNTRARYQRSINQLTKKHAEFCWVANNKFDDYLTILADFHQKRWQRKNSLGAFYHQDFFKFHRQLYKEHGNTIKMSAIIIDNKPVIINYYLTDTTTIYFYQTGWDEANYANFSLGLALHLWSIEHSQHAYYDFMMGSLGDTYKAKFNTTTKAMVNIDIYPNKLKRLFFKVFSKLPTTIFFSNSKE